MTSEELNKNLDIKQCGCGGEVRTDHIYIDKTNEDSILIEEPIYRVYCRQCGISTPFTYLSEAKAIAAWNKAMGGLLPEGDPQKNVGCKYTTSTEKTAKVISDDVIITVNGYNYHHEEYLCNACKNKVFSCDSYCSHCGAKLDWRYL